MSTEQERTALPTQPKAEFEDPRVQLVYGIICGDNHPPYGEHWDGYVSRLIVDALQSPVIRNSRNTAGPKVLSKDEIRAVLLKHGYTIKPGHDDLKPYVYAAARELIALAQGREP